MSAATGVWGEGRACRDPEPHRLTERWLEGNRRWLMESVAAMRKRLESLVAGATPAPDRPVPAHDLPAPPALDAVTRAFGLSPFERDVLLLCAGVELSDEFAAVCGKGAGDPASRRPTFALALAAFAHAHWSAITPAAPLRRHRLIEILPGDGLTHSPLRIDERVLHYLVGISYLDERLAELMTPVPQPDELPPSHRRLVERAVQLWSGSNGAQPVLHLCGPDQAATWAIAAEASAALGLSLHALRVADLPAGAAEREAICRLWEREVLLGAGALLIACDDPESARTAATLAERLPGPTFLAGREPHRIASHAVVRLEVDRPTAEEQREIWHNRLGALSTSLNGQLDTLVSHFSLSARGIHATSVQALQRIEAGEAPAPVLWEACRMHSRAALDDLAQRIEPAAGWDDLIVADAQREILREIAVHVRQRAKVYGAWGFGAKASRGLGISALFSGGSGTGKTMASEVLARDLSLDLYRIDLSQVVSKYIGETEKNLRRVFDAAEQGGAILLFDEADALFGKRSEVKDSHDRYANIEVSYLLSRMETYRGLSILTTNQKSALDPAFLRRLRFFVHFAFPDRAERAEIWRRVFPPGTPTEGLDIDQLARLHVTGGNIRNIALTAAFLAADAGEPVQMKHLALAAARECAKIERPLSEAEIGGWV